MLALGQISNCYKTSSNPTQNEYTNKSWINPQFGKQNMPGATTLRMPGQKGRTQLETLAKTKVK